MSRWPIAFAAAGFLATGAGFALVGTSEPEALTVFHCDGTTGACWVCVDRICEKPGEQVFCCPKPGGDCTPAELMAECDPATHYAVYCEHGQSVPITNADGTAGFLCLQ